MIGRCFTIASISLGPASIGLPNAHPVSPPHVGFLGRSRSKGTNQLKRSATLPHGGPLKRISAQEFALAVECRALEQH